MDYSFKQDTSFLKLVNEYKVKEYSAAITVLDFSTERVVSTLTGKITGGSIAVSGTSSTRRTGSLQLILDEETLNITDINNLISIDKKIAISIGQRNPFYDTDLYREYGEFLWFKQGTFIITGASSSVSTTAKSISIQFIDKMGMLNGTCGGVIPSAVALHESLIIDGDENITVLNPLIKDIIKEVVHHFGGEHYSKIIIDDVPDTGRQVVKWAGSTPVRFAANSGAFIVTDEPTAEEILNFPTQRVLGDDVGYLSTDLTYPGELSFNSGTTVEAVLSQIASTLGNYEYYYDEDGYFHFQQIKNFSMTGEVPTVVDQLSSSSVFNITDEADSQFQSQYLKSFSQDEFLNEFSDSSLVSQVSFNPNYSNIKNDFVVWGTRSSDDTLGSVRYHLAIDERPRYSTLSLCDFNIWEIRALGSREILRYISTASEDGATSIPIPSLGEIGAESTGKVNYRGVWSKYQTYYYNEVPDSIQYGEDYYCLKENLSIGVDGWTIEDFAGSDDSTVQSEYNPSEDSDHWRKIEDSEIEVFLHSPALSLVSGKSKQDSFNWREELYRKALIAYGTSSTGSYYDEELIAEWRGIFNPCLSSLDIQKDVEGYTNPYWSTFKEDWDEYFGEEQTLIPWAGYNISVISSPQSIRYWLDLIDTSSSLSGYSVSKIGRRSVVEENSNINEVLNREVPDILFIDGSKEDEELTELTQAAISIGQSYLVIQSEYLSYLAARPSYGSCYENVRDLFYNHLVYNSGVSLTSLPLFYLDVNKTVRLSFPELGIIGNYSINSISFNLTTISSMNLSLSEIITII